MARHTLRGQFIEGETKRLIVDDGNLNMGHRVISFIVSGDPAASGNDVWATLSKEYDSPSTWNWGDSRQIGWATAQMGVNSHTYVSSIIDPEHIVLMDLFIQGQHSSAGGSGVINYLIELEPVTLTDDEAVLQLIKERSQDDLR